MLVLASSSPRRAELLRQAQIEFVVQAAEVDESRRDGESPLAYAERLAAEKARAVAAQRPQDAVLGADTIVTVGGLVLGKPRDAEDARAMLRSLSARWHEVTTAVCVVGPARGGRRVEQVAHATTRVHFDQISEDDISAYVAGGEPMDKAGAYAVQGVASRWVKEIEGDYPNVVGLPVALVWRLLRAME